MTDDFASIVELLDAFFGSEWNATSVNRISDSELDALAADVETYYSDFTLAPPDEGKFRSYSGGATFAANVAASQPDRSVVRVPDSHLLPFAHAATLYVDEIIIDCPLDAWIFSYRDFASPGPYNGYSGIEIQPISAGQSYGVGFKNADRSLQRTEIEKALARLEILTPAIRAGWIIPVPHLRMWKKRQRAIETQVRYDILNLSLLDTLSKSYDSPPAQSDNIRGLNIVPTEGVIPAHHARAIVESPMLYFDSILAVADSTGSRFLPTTDSDYSLLKQRVADAGAVSLSVRDGLTVGGIKRSLVPVFDELTFETICRVRESESAFSEWRDNLVQLTNGGRYSSTSDLSEHEEIISDSIDEHVTKIRAAVSRSRTLAGRLESMRLDALDVCVAASIWAFPPQSSIVKLLAGVTAPLLRRAVASTISPIGANNSVVAMIDRSNRRNE